MSDSEIPYTRMSEPMSAVLFDSVNSYYAGLVRVALAENNVSFTSHYVNMPKCEQLAPWYMRINPAGTVPALRAEDGQIVNESRTIVNWAYGSDESAGDKEILDQLYSECPGSLAWLCGEAKILLLKIMVHSPAMKILLPRTIRKHQAGNPDLHELYEKKLSAMSKKHFTKSITDVQHNIQRVVESLEKRRILSGGPWLLGASFGRADAVACAYLQWIVRCNAYGAAPITIPEGMLEYLARAQARPSFQVAIGQHGKDAFVLTMFESKQRFAGRVLASLALLCLCGPAAYLYLRA